MAPVARSATSEPEIVPEADETVHTPAETGLVVGATEADETGHTLAETGLVTSVIMTTIEPEIVLEPDEDVQTPTVTGLAAVAMSTGSNCCKMRWSATEEEAWSWLRQATVYCNSKPVGTNDRVYGFDSAGHDECSGVRRVWPSKLLKSWKGCTRFLDIEVLCSFFFIIVELVLYQIEMHHKTDENPIRIANFCLGFSFGAYTVFTVVRKFKKAASSTQPEISLHERRRLFGLCEPLDVVDYGLALVFVSMVTYDVGRLSRGKGTFSYPSAPFWVSVLVFLARLLGCAAQTRSPSSDIEAPRPSDLSPNRGSNKRLVSVMNFVPCGLAFLMPGKHQNREIVKNFLWETIKLMGRRKIGDFTVDKGVMPLALRVAPRSHGIGEMLIDDSCAVTPSNTTAFLDSGLWWIVLLRAYTKSSGDALFHTLPQIQKGIKRILNVNLRLRSLASLGREGRSIEREILLYLAMRCTEEMLEKDRANMEIFANISKQALEKREFIQLNFWFDETKLQETNLSRELANFVPQGGGYFIGEGLGRERNLQWISATNLMAIVSGLATMEQSKAIMNLIDANWEKLVGEMPLKRVFPAGYWEIGSQVDAQNEIWSQCDNASWPGMLWLLTAGCMAAGRPEMAKRAISLAEGRLAADQWPEYYGGEMGRNTGSPMSQNHVPTIGSYLVSTLITQNPENLSMITI